MLLPAANPPEPKPIKGRERIITTTPCGVTLVNVDALLALPDVKKAIEEAGKIPMPEQVEGLEREIRELRAQLASEQRVHKSVIEDLRAQLEDENPGTPRGRIAGLSRYAEENLGHSPSSSRGPEAVILEALEAAQAERDQLRAQLTEARMLAETNNFAWMERAERADMYEEADKERISLRAERDKLRDALELARPFVYASTHPAANDLLHSIDAVLPRLGAEPSP
jgi:hypothetical protein